MMLRALFTAWAVLLGCFGADATSLMTSQMTMGRNLLVNGSFSVNQRAYASGAALAQGAFGHDHWFNNSASNNYTFTQASTVENGSASPDTIVSIPSGMLLAQKVEHFLIAGGSYTLSWQGTATCQVQYTAGSTTTTVQAAAASPETFALPTGVTPVVSCGGGTLTTIQLELGAQQTQFERRPQGLEFALCERYFYRFATTSYGKPGIGVATSATIAYFPFQLPAPMRAAPVVSFGGNFAISGGISASVTNIAVDQASSTYASLTITSSGMTTGSAYILQGSQTGNIDFSSEF